MADGNGGVAKPFAILTSLGIDLRTIIYIGSLVAMFYGTWVLQGRDIADLSKDNVIFDKRLDDLSVAINGATGIATQLRQVQNDIANTDRLAKSADDRTTALSIRLYAVEKAQGEIVIRLETLRDGLSEIRNRPPR